MALTEPPEHWKKAKEILMLFADEITNRISYDKSKKWKHGRRVSFIYFYPGEKNFIKMTFNRVKEMSDFGFATTMGKCGYVEIYLSDLVYEKQYKHLFTFITHVITYHELVHTLQHHDGVVDKLDDAERFAVSAELENRATDDYFLELTNWEEMDATLAEFWFMHERLPKSENEYHRWFKDVHGLPTKMLKRAVTYIWNYFFNDKKNLEERFEVFKQLNGVVEC